MPDETDDHGGLLDLTGTRLDELAELASGDSVLAREALRAAELTDEPYAGFTSRV